MANFPMENIPYPTPVVLSFSPELRQKIASETHWSERKLEALCLGVPPDKYCDRDDIAPEAEREKVRRAIREAIKSGRLKATSTGGGNLVYGGQWRIERETAIRWAVGCKFEKFPKMLVSPGLDAKWASQDAERHVVGRYTLWEAAAILEPHAGEHADVMLGKLMQGVRDDVLPAYEPGNLVPCQPKAILPFYEAYWDDLNSWLGKKQRRISFRFPSPAPALTLVADQGGVKAVTDADSTKTRSGGRPRSIEKKTPVLRQIITIMTEGIKLDPNALPGNATNLLDACKRIEKSKTTGPELFKVTEGTFKTWLCDAGYAFKVGRTPKVELNYWTTLCVKTMGKIPADIFP